MYIQHTTLRIIPLVYAAMIHSLLLQNQFRNINTVIGKRCSILAQPSSLINRGKTSYREFVFYEPNHVSSSESVHSIDNELKQLNHRRPQLFIYPVNTASKRLWAVFDCSLTIQLDCIELPDYFVSGKNQLTIDESVEKWDASIKNRISTATTTQSTDYLATELQHAVSVVKSASFISRSLQMILIGKHIKQGSSSSSSTGSSISKDDKSPVTIADFVVQALVIDYLSKIFPNDRFIAEEDSTAFQKAFEEVSSSSSSSDASKTVNICNTIISILSNVTNEEWTKERLFTVLDKGQFDGFRFDSSINGSSGRRVWVLDPIDGTKGFLRNQHYCIALALLVDGKPQLSVLGCPNLNLQSVLQSVGNCVSGALTNITKVSAIDPSMCVQITSSTLPSSSSSSSSAATSAVAAVDEESVNMHLFPPTAGSLFFAVSGQGAFAKTLSMAQNAAYEVNVDSVDTTNLKSRLPYAILCEATESSHGNRDVTLKVSQKLNLKNEFLRLDGQCKYGAVGSGAAHGNLRLPPRGYQEKIWDHAPGVHFVTECGGQVTDLQGNKIDFARHGRYLDPSIRGIVSSSGGSLHQLLLDTINQVQAEVDRASDSSGSSSSPRVFGQN